MADELKPISTRDSTIHLYAVIRSLGIDNLNKTWVYLTYSFILNFLSIVYQLIAFTVSYVISSDQMSTDTFLTSLQVAMNVYSVALKVLVVYMYMPRLRETDLILKELDAKIQTKEERNMAEHMIRFCNSVILIYIICYFSYSTTTFLAALYNGHPPFSIYMPYCDWKESFTKRMIASFIEYALVNVSCLQDVGVDAYPVVFIYMARMHMKILCLRVERLGKDPTQTDEDNFRSLTDCIDTHRKILEFVETVRPVISKTVFIQLVVTAAVMAITLINILLFANLASAIGSSFFLLSVTLETLPMCYSMNVLAEEINSLPTSLFHSAWYNQNKIFRRMVLFFLQNAQKFNNIIALGILPVQVSSFISIAKLAFSVYALVRQNQNRHAAQLI